MILVFSEKSVIHSKKGNASYKPNFILGNFWIVKA